MDSHTAAGLRLLRQITFPQQEGVFKKPAKCACSAAKPVSKDLLWVSYCPAQRHLAGATPNDRKHGQRICSSSELLQCSNSYGRIPYRNLLWNGSTEGIAPGKRN